MHKEKSICTNASFFKYTNTLTLITTVLLDAHTLYTIKVKFVNDVSGFKELASFILAYVPVNCRLILQTCKIRCKI